MVRSPTTLDDPVWSGPPAGKRYVGVFDGRHAAFLRSKDREGTPRDRYLVAEDEVKDWELEKAWVFPAFFDHPAEYLGERAWNGASVHVLRVNLPLGARADYFVDGASYRASAIWANRRFRGHTSWEEWSFTRIVIALRRNRVDTPPIDGPS